MNSRSTNLLRSFQVCDLDAGAFRHLDHIAVAYEMLSRHDFIDAAQAYATGIRSLAGKAGVPGKFNATITLAFLSLIADRMATQTHDNYDEFIAENQDLRTIGILTSRYSPTRLNSDLARRVFLMLDA